MYFLSSFPCKFDDKFNCQVFTGLLFYAYMYVVIHQVRMLVFDNYQTCPVSLSSSIKLGLGFLYCGKINGWFSSQGTKSLYSNKESEFLIPDFMTSHTSALLSSSPPIKSVSILLRLSSFCVDTLAIESWDSARGSSITMLWRGDDLAVAGLLLGVNVAVKMPIGMFSVWQWMKRGRLERELFLS